MKQLHPPLMLKSGTRWSGSEGLAQSHAHCDPTPGGLYQPSRRAVLKTLAAAGLVSLVPASWAVAQNSGPASKLPKLIDIHHHLFPPKYVADNRSALLGFGLPAKVLDTTVAESLDEMDRNGVVKGILSLSPPALWASDAKSARQINDWYGQVSKDHPGRYGLFAELPLLDTDASLREIEYAFDTLKADGVGLVSSYVVDGKSVWPGDPRFAPIFAELNRRKAVVFVHPTAPICCVKLNAPAGVVELPFDTTRCAASLVYGGTMYQCPNISVVLGQGGGTTPMLAARMSGWGNIDPKLRATKVPRGAAYYLGLFNYDIAQVTAAPDLVAMFEQVPTSQVLFGTDWPYKPIAVTIKEFHTAMAKLDGLGNGDIQAIDYGNAMRLLPGLKA